MNSRSEPSRPLSTLIVSALFAGVLVAVASAAGGAERVLDGHWLAGLDDGGPLIARFRPAGEGRWDVAFDFDFQGQAHTFSGEARGTLTEGDLEGRVTNESRTRTWVFSGSWASDGEYRGEHVEIEHGERVPTGTLTLRRRATAEEGAAEEGASEDARNEPPS